MSSMTLGSSTMLLWFLYCPMKTFSVIFIFVGRISLCGCRYTWYVSYSVYVLKDKQISSLFFISHTLIFDFNININNFSINICKKALDCKEWFDCIPKFFSTVLAIHFILFLDINSFLKLLLGYRNQEFFLDGRL